MNRKNIRLIIPILIIVELSFIFLTFMSYQNKVVESKETSKIDKEKFAMYRENMDGEYEKIETTNGMTDRYSLNPTKTLCTDTNKEEVKDIISFSNSKITVKTNKTVFCYLYFDMLKDLTINVSTDGVDNTVPTTLGYTKTINCNNGSTPTWNYKYNRLEFGNVLGKEEVCNLTYTKDNNTYQTLRDVVENDDEIVHETANIVSLDAQWAPLEQEEYKDYVEGWGGSFRHFQFEFEEESKKWVSTMTADSSNQSATFDFYVSDPGYYKLCYDIPSTSSGTATRNYIIYTYSSSTNTKIYVYSNTYNGPKKSECVDYGYLNPGSEILVYAVYYTDNTSLWLEKENSLVNSSAGYRYEGANPNNYIWFNDERWRIIGSIPTKIAEDGTHENLVKIIKDTPLTYLGYSQVDNSYLGRTNWDDNTLFSLLNDYYYGAKDATGKEFINNYPICVHDSIRPNCNYLNNGIKPDSDYGKMVEEVYWDTGVTSPGITASEMYSRERINQSVKGYVGLMSASDYGFASSASHETTLNIYNNTSHTKNNWLYNYGEEWLISQRTFPRSGDDILFSLNPTSEVTSNQWSSYGKNIRPVVYLDSSVYVTDGDGSYSNPYYIRMN